MFLEVCHGRGVTQGLCLTLLLMVGCCCCTAAVAVLLLLLCRCCCTAAAAVLLLPQVQEVVLVELEGAKVSHTGVGSAVSSSWGGSAAFTVLTLSRQEAAGAGGC